jgi:hypothetical protein
VLIKTLKKGPHCQASNNRFLLWTQRVNCRLFLQQQQELPSLTKVVYKSETLHHHLGGGKKMCLSRWKIAAAAQFIAPPKR